MEEKAVGVFGRVSTEKKRERERGRVVPFKQYRSIAQNELRVRDCRGATGD